MKSSVLAVLFTSLIILLLTQTVQVAGTGVPPGTEERLLEAEAVSEYTVDLYFDKAGNRVDDWTESYYGSSYQLKFVLSFWNVGALGWSTDHKYADAEMKAVFSPDGTAYATQEEKMYKEANAPWEGKHFDEYKNDPAWIEANKKLEAEIEAIREIELSSIEESVETLYFTGGAWGQFKTAETFELVGKIAQAPDTSHFVQLTKGYDYTEFAAKFGLPGGAFSEFKITSKQPFLEWAGYYEGGVTVKEQVFGSISISDMSGEVEIQQPGEDSWDLANPGKVGFQADGGIIRTGPESYVRIFLSNDISITIGPDSEIKFIKSDPMDSKLKLIYGNLMANVKKMIKDGTMEITMNQAVAGIKGTVFVCEENGKNSTLKVLEGTVEFTDMNGQLAVVKTGDKISADVKGLMPTGKFDEQQEQAIWDRLQKSGNRSSRLMLIIVIAAGIPLLAGLVLFILFIFRRSRQN